MNDERINEYLLKLIEDVSIIKTKVEMLDEFKAEMKMTDLRIDELIATTREHDKSIKSLEHRNDEMEKFVRNNLTDSKKQTTKTFISMGLSVFSIIVTAIVTFFFNLL